MQSSFFENLDRVGGPRSTSVPAFVPLERARQPTLFEMQYTEAGRMRRAAEEVAVSRIADLAHATWDALEATLSRIIGSKAVTALYKRSLYLTRGDHPWLIAAYEDSSPAAAFLTLKQTVLRQSLAHANAALNALLHAFRGLLLGLFGEALTERLLEPVGALPFKAM